MLRPYGRAPRVVSYRDSYLEQLGLEGVHIDSCAWVWRPGGRQRGMILDHINDFLISGGKKDKEWQDVLAKIRI